MKLLTIFSLFRIILGHFPRIPQCFLRKRMRNHAVNLKPVATNSLWTNKRCVCVCIFLQAVDLLVACLQNHVVLRALTIVVDVSQSGVTPDSENLTLSSSGAIDQSSCTGTPLSSTITSPEGTHKLCLHIHVGTVVFSTSLNQRSLLCWWHRNTF